MNKSDPPRVALLIETSCSYGRDLLVGIAQYVRVHGAWSIQFKEGAPTRQLPAWFKRWHGDGVIARVETQAMADVIAKLKVPAIDVYGGLPGLKMTRIRSDAAAAGRMAAEHLIERGFRRFAFCGFNGAEWSDRRRAGFVEHVKAAGFSCEVFDSPRPSPQATVLDYEELALSYEPKLANWLKVLPKPIGLMACNDVQGRQALNACRAVGILVPDEIAVIGIDSDELICGLSVPPLSSVILNTTRIGYEAAAMLADMMAGKTVPPDTRLIEPQGIATRRSTDIVSVDDPNLAKALLFIRDHACDGANLDEVASAAGLSRTVLQRRFQAELKQTVHEAVIRVRLRRACELLSGTDLSLVVVAEKAGFKHSEYMGSVFKQRLGKTPAQFRFETNPHMLGRIC